MYTCCHCYMFRPHMGHHQVTFIIWGDNYTVHFVLSAIRHIVAVVNFLRRIFSSYLFLETVSVFLFSVSLNLVVRFSVVCSLSFFFCN
jgi:hypothetical protein